MNVNKKRTPSEVIGEDCGCDKKTFPEPKEMTIYPIGFYREPLIDYTDLVEVKQYYERYKWDIVDSSDENPATWDEWMTSEHYYILTGQLNAEHHEVLNS